MTIGWGIVGIGTHADHEMAPALNQSANTRLVAVCSRDIQRARGFAAKHGVVQAYDSLDKMLQDPELDVVYIATPNNLHVQQAVEVAEAGKHILCEKPMALTVADCESMLQACNKNKVKLGVCYQHRYHPAHVEARRYIQSGDIGNISVAKVQLCHPSATVPLKGWRSDPSMAGAGALMGQGIHCVDLLRYLLDSEVTEVRAMTDEEPPRHPVDEMVYCILKFENGAHGMVTAGILAPASDNDAVLYGSKAKLTCKRTLGRQIEKLGELLVDGDSLNVRMTFPTEEPSLYNNSRVIAAVNKWIEDDTEPYISGENGLKMVGITNAIIESSRRGMAVKIA